MGKIHWRYKSCRVDFWKSVTVLVLLETQNTEWYAWLISSESFVGVALEYKSKLVQNVRKQISHVRRPETKPRPLDGAVQATCLKMVMRDEMNWRDTAFLSNALLGTMYSTKQNGATLKVKCSARAQSRSLCQWRLVWWSSEPVHRLSSDSVIRWFSDPLIQLFIDKVESFLWPKFTCK